MTTTDRLRAAAGLAVLGVAALVFWTASPSAPPLTVPSSVAPQPDDRVLPPPAAAGASPLVAASLRADSPSEDPHPETQAAVADDEPGVMPLTIVLHGPEEWRENIPVAILWQLDPVELVPLQSVLHTDGEGRAPARTPRFEARPQWFWADLGFPTLGLAATPIPDDGGEVVIPMVMPAYIDVEVREGGGLPTEPVIAELRVAGARTPGDRWHRFPLAEGRGHCMVEAGVDLEVRLSTRSGRTAATRVRASTVPEESVPCRLELAATGRLAVHLATADGAPLAAIGIAIEQRDTGRSVAMGLTATDDRGVLRFWLPGHLRGDYELWLTLRATVAGKPMYGELHLDHRQIREGGELGSVTIAPVPVAVSGLAADQLDRPRTNVAIVLELGREPSDEKERAQVGADGLVWRTIAETRSDAEGRFELLAISPPGARLRLQTPRAAGTQPMPVRAGAAAVRLLVPPRRGAFGRTSNDG